MAKKKILALMVEAGNGHKSPAMAINHAIEQEFPGQFETVILDAFKDVGCNNVDTFIKESWREILKFPGSLTRTWYNFVWQSRFITHMSERSVGLFFKNRLAKRIREENPDLIFSTYFITTHFLSILKRQGLIDVPVVAVNTDPFNVHAAWLYHTVDSYVVFSQKVKEELEPRCDCREVQVFNYPLRPAFAGSAEDQKTLRVRLGLETDMPTLLVTSGGEGVGTVGEYIEALFKNDLPTQILAVCGRNETLKARLESLQNERSRARLKVYGFVTNMDELMAASDVVLGKAGASTTFECLVTGRPIIHTNYMPNEQGTTEFVLENGFGWYAPDCEDFLTIMRDIVQDPSILADCKKRIESGGFMNGSRAIARYIVEYLESWTLIHRSSKQDVIIA